ncbi:hypothetical protein CRM22_002958 [Opisthorchis felineus]|uniref:protein-serine/threonine phosphatase n=1 Tax=Opisthorchis felineus TaxID=147828 RepID=A0A4S2M856_OPIFE|nr:hypothetical protein CRM22_002958 [Opisthorchis felineus]
MRGEHVTAGGESTERSPCVSNFEPNTNGDTDEDEDDDSEDEDVELTGEADEDASSTEDSEDTDDDDEDEDEDEAIRGLRLGVPSALKDQDDSEPGVDSGTTACVALLLPYNGIVKLFVANAGDSRAVLCRGTVAVDLSVDHKPEDEDEKSRITAAGGTVTRDGRVNGGLNLSRALGDHSYKQVQGLPLAAQMITPSPDVTQFDLIPGSDQFLVIACDGVWNSMTSQEVVDFVRERLQSKLDTQGGEVLTPTSDRESNAITLSKICEEIFDHCLAPNTDGDGTGCDNMTCIIVRFDNLEGLAKRSSESSCNLANARKRAAAAEKVSSDETATTVDEFNTITSSKRVRSDVPPLNNSAIKTGVTNGDCI